MPVSRAGVPVAARAGSELLQPLFQSARGADIADLLAARRDEALRSSELDEFGEAGMVCGGVSADDFALSADLSRAGQAAASGGWAGVPGGVFGAGGEKSLAPLCGSAGGVACLSCVIVSDSSSRWFCWRAVRSVRLQLQLSLPRQRRLCQGPLR